MLLIPGSALSTGVEGGNAINQKLIAMVAMFKRHLGGPTAIGLALHRVGIWAPIIKVANDGNMLSVRSQE